ncbi:hypothetical protein ACFCYF_23665 [Streptomyces chartreusis]|uniref:hypothetical protein n=1 Tax=Streptomyces chartreusis TaxID=1969 RepID=UPI0035D714FC
MDRARIPATGSRSTASQPREIETTPEVITLAERERRRATTTAGDGIAHQLASATRHIDD